MQLVISTATAACSVALVDGATIVAEVHETIGRGHAERLIPVIASLPGKGRADHIFVDCGPGSFTGVRVGLAAARALALAWKAELHGFSTLALIAAGMADGSFPSVGVSILGGHGELFIQGFARFPLTVSTPLGSFRPDEAAGMLKDDIVLGNGAEALVAARGYGRALDALPCAVHVPRLPVALRSLPPVPIYGRRPDAVAL